MGINNYTNKCIIINNDIELILLAETDILDKIYKVKGDILCIKEMNEPIILHVSI